MLKVDKRPTFVARGVELAVAHEEAVKSALVGVALNINATDLAEAGLDALTEACNKV